MAIFLTVLCFNLLGDGLRDVLDPRQRTLMGAASGAAPAGDET
jgi:peptide/nickel transport system permease protein